MVAISLSVLVVHAHPNPDARQAECSLQTEHRLAARLVQPARDALTAVRRSRFDLLAVDFSSGLIDHHDRKCAAFGARVVSHLPGQSLAMLDRAAGGWKFQPLPVADRNPVPHVEIVGSHRRPRCHNK
jgi:hypothetical protein